MKKEKTLKNLEIEYVELGKEFTKKINEVYNIDIKLKFVKERVNISTELLRELALRWIREDIKIGEKLFGKTENPYTEMINRWVKRLNVGIEEMNVTDKDIREGKI